jgi:hypothetical protein
MQIWSLCVLTHADVGCKPTVGHGVVAMAAVAEIVGDPRRSGLPSQQLAIRVLDAGTAVTAVLDRRRRLGCGSGSHHLH